MAPPSVPSSPNPRLIRPTQPRGRWIHGLLSAGHAFPLLSRGGENHRLCFLRARKNRAGVPTYCHDTSRFSDLLLCPPPRRAIPCWSRTDLTAEGSRCRFDAHKRPRPRRATRASTQGRSHEVHHRGVSSLRTMGTILRPMQQPQRRSTRTRVVVLAVCV